MVDIIIVNWNSGDHLRRCINSVIESVNEIDYRIIVVDNNSGDESQMNIPLRETDTLLSLNKNYGFARACNIGAKASESDFILFLNPDTVMLPDTLEKAVLVLASDSSVGIVGVRQESDDRMLLPSCSRFFRLRNLLFDVSGLSKLAPSVFKPSTLMTDWGHNESKAVDQVMGSFVLIKRSVFNSINGFDERFFVYFEDMDLAKRLNKQGLISFYFNDVSIIHTGCGASESVKDIRLFYSLSSRIKYGRKHLGKLEALMILIITIFPEPVSRILYAAFAYRSLKDVLNIAMGYKLFYRWLIKGK